MAQNSSKWDYKKKKKKVSVLPWLEPCISLHHLFIPYIIFDTINKSNRSDLILGTINLSAINH